MIKKLISVVLLGSFGAAAYPGLTIDSVREGWKYDSAQRKYRVAYSWTGVNSNGFPIVQPTNPMISEILSKYGEQTSCRLGFALYSEAWRAGDGYTSGYTYGSVELDNNPAGTNSKDTHYTSEQPLIRYWFERKTDCITALNEMGVTYGFFNSNATNTNGFSSGGPCVSVRRVYVESSDFIVPFALEGCAGDSGRRPVNCSISVPKSIDFGIMKPSELNNARYEEIVNISCQDAANTVLFAVDPTAIPMGDKLSVLPELCVGNSCESMKTVTFNGSYSINLRTTLQSDNKNPPEGGIYQAHIILSANYY